MYTCIPKLLTLIGPILMNICFVMKIITPAYVFKFDLCLCVRVFFMGEGGGMHLSCLSASNLNSNYRFSLYMV